MFLIITVSVPQMTNAMPIHMALTTFYPIIIQFDEETIQLWVTYTINVFNPYETSVLFVGQRQVVQANIRRHRLPGLIRFSTACLQDILIKFV